MQPAEDIANAVFAYDGPERRTSRRSEFSYPVRVRMSSPSGERQEHYSQTRNISSGGVLFAYSGTLSPGTEVDVAIAIPPAYSDFMPATQLDATAVVIRSEPIADANGWLTANVALKFLTKPTLSAELSMFD